MYVGKIKKKDRGKKWNENIGDQALTYPSDVCRNFSELVPFSFSDCNRRNSSRRAILGFLKNDAMTQKERKTNGKILAFLYADRI
jgi:hypothetical protein